jgi:hypothetical protein
MIANEIISTEIKRDRFMFRPKCSSDDRKLKSAEINYAEKWVDLNQFQAPRVLELALLC